MGFYDKKNPPVIELIDNEQKLFWEKIVKWWDRVSHWLWWAEEEKKER